MTRNTYFITHHGTFWFQIRVPKSHQARHGKRVRVCLQTTDKDIARALAMRLASEWLLRFMESPLLASLPAVASSPIALPQPETPSVAQPGPESSMQLGADAQATRFADMPALFCYWRDLNKDRVGSSVKEFESLAKKFSSIVNKAPAQLIRTDIAAFRDHLLSAGDARATVTKKLSFVNAMLQSAFDAGYLPSNVARGMKVPRPKVEPVKRMPFSTKDLRVIFSSAIYTKRFRPKGGREDAFAWVPVLAYVTGARLEELCQLRLADVLHDRKHGWYLNIGDGDSQRVKTESSRRIVPLHPAVIEAGFIRYVEALRVQKSDWVFPALKADNDGRRGGNFGKVFARFLRSAEGCGITDPRLVFHSFRHTFKTMCRDSSIVEEVHDALTGHVGASVGRDYGTVPLSRLALAMSQLALPVALPKLA